MVSEVLQEYNASSRLAVDRGRHPVHLQRDECRPHDSVPSPPDLSRLHHPPLHRHPHAPLRMLAPLLHSSL